MLAVTYLVCMSKVRSFYRYIVWNLLRILYSGDMALFAYLLELYSGVGEVWYRDYSPTSIIRTQDAKKMQSQSTHCDHVTGLHMRS